MLKPWLYRLRCKRLLKNCQHDFLCDYLSGQITQSKQELTPTRLLALDLETTGLDTSDSQVISMGWVIIENNKINLASARHYLLNSSVQMNQSAVIHGITDSDIQNGFAIESIFKEFIQTLKGSCLLAHNAVIEKEFLNLISQEYFSQELPLRLIDTLKREQQRFRMSGQNLASGGLRLAACRERYNLPVYRAHNALSDALACAELYLAQESY